MYMATSDLDPTLSPPPTDEELARDLAATVDIDEATAAKRRSTSTTTAHLPL